MICHTGMATMKSQLNTETSQKSNKKNFWAWVVVGFISLLFILSIYDEVGNERIDQDEESQDNTE